MSEENVVQIINAKIEPKPVWNPDELQEIAQFVWKKQITDLESYVEYLLTFIDKKQKVLKLDAFLEEQKKYRIYTLQECYDRFAHRTYTDIIRKVDNQKMIIYGLVISSGTIKIRIQTRMESEDVSYVELDALLKDYNWVDGSPCGVKI